MGYLGIRIGEKTAQNKHGQGRNTGQVLSCVPNLNTDKRGTQDTVLVLGPPLSVFISRCFFINEFIPTSSHSYPFFSWQMKFQRYSMPKKGSLL